MKVLVIMNNLMRKHVGFILLSLSLALFTISGNIGMLSSSSVLISRAALHPDVLDLMILIVLIRFFGISRGVFRYLERIISHNTTFKILSSLRQWCFKDFNESYSENNKHFKAGDVYTKLVYDVDILKDFFLRVLYPFITAVLTGVLTSIYINFFSSTLALVYIITYSISGFLLPLVLFNLNRNLMKKESIIKGKINLVLLDILNGILEVYVFSLQKAFSKKYHLLCKELSSVQFSKNLIAVLGDNIHAFLISLLMAFSLLVTAPSVASGDLSGIYYAMLPIAIMASFEALIPMPTILYKWNESLTAANNIFSVASSHTENLIKETVMNGYTLSVDNLNVVDTESGNYILKDISFELPPGRKLAVVGLSGSGKSTLIKTLLGFMNFREGDIKLGGASYRNIDIDEVRRYFTYVEQTPYIFNATINENIRIANPKAGDADVMDVLRKAHISGFVEELPDGLNTLLGQFGSRVSGGEKQRLAIARALLKDCPIVLLDEPTAGLDVELEKKITESIHSAIKDKSCVWVTHRLINMDMMDEIIVLNKGEIVEKGTHEELIDKGGLYFRLWSIQKELNSTP